MIISKVRSGYLTTLTNFEIFIDASPKGLKDLWCFDVTEEASVLKLIKTLNCGRAMYIKCGPMYSFQGDMNKIEEGDFLKLESHQCLKCGRIEFYP